jgi:hypothetical protein
LAYVSASRALTLAELRPGARCKAQDCEIESTEKCKGCKQPATLEAHSKPTIAALGFVASPCRVTY